MIANEYGMLEEQWAEWVYAIEQDVFNNLYSLDRLALPDVRLVENAVHRGIAQVFAEYVLRRQLELRKQQRT